MSEYDRHFARRSITWKISNVVRETFEKARSPWFTMHLGDNVTKWRLIASRNSGADKFLVYPLLNAEVEQFSTTFTVSIMKQSKAAQVLPDAETSSKGNGCRGIAYDILFDEKSQFLDESELTLEIKIELLENPKIVEPPRFDLMIHLETLINNEEYSDFIFICSDGVKIHVQETIIASQFETFATPVFTLVSRKWKKVAQVNIDSETMLELIRFLYCRRVNNIKKIQEKLVFAAHNSRIENLKALCVSSMMESLNDENVVGIYEIADFVGEEHLKENCVDYINCHFSQYKDCEPHSFSNKLWCSLWKSVVLKSTRLCFKNKEELKNAN